MGGSRGEGEEESRTTVDTSGICRARDQEGGDKSHGARRSRVGDG